MKLSIKLATMAFASILFFACEGPPGPRGAQGPAGYDGLDGLDGEEAYTFDFENVDFNAGNNFEQFLDFPGTFQMLDAEVALVYLLWDNDPVIWTPIPQTFFDTNGIFQYNFDFTADDIRIFMEGNFDLNTLGAEYTDDWVVRVVVVPAQFTSGGRIDLGDYNAVKEHFNLPDKPVKTQSNLVRPSL